MLIDNILLQIYRIKIGEECSTCTTNIEHNNTLENHCTRTAQSSRGGCSRRVQKVVYLAVNQGNILVNVLRLKIFIANYYHL